MTAHRLQGEASPNRSSKREGRISVRASESQRRLLQQAADASGKSLTSFVLDAASREAERALTDRRLFVLDPEQWKRFNETLDRPAVDKPRLRAFLRNPVDVD